MYACTVCMYVMCVYIHTHEGLMHVYNKLSIAAENKLLQKMLFWYV